MNVIVLRKLDELIAAQERSNELLESLLKRTDVMKPAAAPANLSPYCGDNYSRTGCTMVIQIAEDQWCLRVYAPGYAPVGELGCIERYFARPHGSTGIAVDAFIQRGADLRHVLPEMGEAERAYASVSGSIVTA